MQSCHRRDTILLWTQSKQTAGKWSVCLAPPTPPLLSHLQDPNPGANKLLCNTQELEDCDMPSEQSFSLMYFDGDSLKPTHVVSAAAAKHLDLESLHAEHIQSVLTAAV